MLSSEKGMISLPVEDASVDVAAQNCLFNIFKAEELRLALQEMHRVLRPGGDSDPVSEPAILENLVQDEHLRALCLTGALSLSTYIKLITGAGFGTVEIRARRHYRILDPEVLSPRV
jgi:ubiquinone/menaquinone biosynthesis C-methylase UbiE